MTSATFAECADVCPHSPFHILYQVSPRAPEDRWEKLRKAGEQSSKKNFGPENESVCDLHMCMCVCKICMRCENSIHKVIIVTVVI